MRMNFMECCHPSRGDQTPARIQEVNPTWDLSRWMGQSGTSITLWGTEESAADVLVQLRYVHAPVARARPSAHSGCVNGTPKP